MSLDLDRQLREYCRLMDEAQGSISVHEVLERSGELQVVPAGATRRRPSPRGWSAVAIAAVVALSIAVGVLLLRAGDREPAGPVPTTTIPGSTDALGGGWVAFSTQPGGAQVSAGDRNRGGDIYLVRPGEEPRRIVARAGSAPPVADWPGSTNVCPTFSPDGSKLAYGELAGSEASLVVLNVDADGSVSELARIGLGQAEAAPCPRWLHDGARLAYLSVQDAGLETVVVRGLDGSAPPVGDADPTVMELRATMPASDPLDGVKTVPSPNGSLVARIEGTAAPIQYLPGTVWHDGFRVTVANADGSQKRNITAPGEFNFYGIAGWSPDGRYVLVMRDNSGITFQIFAISVEEPFEMTLVVDSIRVNGGGSWPGFGDVSWQPAYSGA